MRRLSHLRSTRYRLLNAAGESLGTFHHRAAADTALATWKGAATVVEIRGLVPDGAIVLTSKGKALADELDAAAQKRRAA